MGDIILIHGYIKINNRLGEIINQMIVVKTLVLDRMAFDFQTDVFENIDKQVSFAKSV